MEFEQAIERIVEIIRNSNDGSTIDFLVPGYAAKTLTSFQSMREDLLLCRDAVTKLLNPEFDNTIKSCLWHTIIILYGKCFTDADDGLVKLVPKDCYKPEQQKFINTHEKLMHLRNKFVAHRSSTNNEFSVAYFKMDLESLDMEAKIKSIRRISPSTEDLNAYLELIDHLVNIVESKFKRAAEKTWKHIIDKFTPEQITFLKIAGPTVPTNLEKS